MVKKTIEETYKKLDPIEHILVRPDTYIGSVKKQTEELWINEKGKMKRKYVTYSPGFMKIFDEILTNATDHSFSHADVTQIKINYSKESGELSVWNNGPGIPIVEHKEHKIYVPELIFGHLLTGSNYNDSDDRTGAGRNGYGAKVNNVFSIKFTIETVDSEKQKKFIQTFSNNMKEKTEPKITKCSGKSYTKITFTPDYKRFEMDGLEDDTILLINKRVIDCIACTSSTVKIYLNDDLLKGKGMVDYVKYFFEEKVIYESSIQTINGLNFVWEYAIVPSDGYNQVSFVNGNTTNQGGKHVDFILYQIIKGITEYLEKKKVKDIRQGVIKDRLFLFLRATVVNPTFNSQTKETLTTASKDFGCKVTVSEDFIKKVCKTPIIDEIIEYSKKKDSLMLSKATDGRKVSKVFIPKLEDALWAGTAKSNECTIIFTEGLSALTFAAWGRSVVGIEKYGIFPLKGVILNTRDASISQLTNNEEINNVKQILGLKENKVYKDTKELRYGKVMLLTDADLDGSHIRNLFINFIHNGWPDLIKLPFIQTLKTYIVKAVKGNIVKEFFTEQDYKKWDGKGYKIKYYKGLGTSTKQEAKNIFTRLNELLVDYIYKSEQCDKAILLAFDKDKNNKGSEKCSDLRKKWLSNYDKNIYINMNEKQISYNDLINKELIHFSIYDNTRSIPSICDGLKPSQRKIMYYMLKHNIQESQKVAQLSGKISSETCYHHGEVSLEGAIINMAQNFTGSNNINLLNPSGNHGSRYLGGKDAASSRYIFTKLEHITNFIFNKDDLPLLNYINDDGTQIEPEWFLPIIPMVLINGCEGIGTGYSTYIPPYNPLDIINSLLLVLNSKNTTVLSPYFEGFNGTIINENDGKYTLKGIYEKISDSQIKITELPIGMWVTNYKEFLETLIVTNKNCKKPLLSNVINSTKDENTDICFIVEFNDSKTLSKLISDGTLEKELKLTKSINTNNMHVFTKDLILTKYNNPNDILSSYFELRLDYYKKRRLYWLDNYTKELHLLKMKERFITEYIDGKLHISKKSKQQINELLENSSFTKQNESFDYLLSMPIYSLTDEKITLLKKQISKLLVQLNYFKSKTEKELYKIDLEELKKVYKNYLVERINSQHSDK